MEHHKDILRIVLREMKAYGHAYRLNWSDFDGRSLRAQLDSIAEWATQAESDPAIPEYTEGSDFLNYMKADLGY